MCVAAASSLAVTWMLSMPLLELRMRAWVTPRSARISDSASTAMSEWVMG